MTPRAILLLGGLGTRLRPFTLERPKPLLPILNRPLIAHQVGALKRHGVREVVLALGHKAAHFRRYLGDGRAWGVKFIYSPEREPLGTGGAIRNAARWVTGPTLIVNGDILCDFDATAFLRFHRKKKAEVSLALTSAPDPSLFGVVETDRGGRILSFLEKPSADQIRVNTVNAGFYLFEPSLFREIPEGRAVSVEREVFPALLRRGRRLFGFPQRGYWSDIGTLESYHAAHADLAAEGFDGLPPPGFRRVRPGVWAGPGVRLHPSARVRGRALLGKGCRVEEGASLEGFVCMGGGGVIGARSLVSDTVLHARVRVGADCRVEGSVVGEGARLGAFSRVGPGWAVPPGALWGDHGGSFGVGGLKSRVGMAKIPR